MLCRLPLILLLSIALNHASAMADTSGVLAEQCASCHNVIGDDNGVMTSINGMDTASICRAFADKAHQNDPGIMGRLIRSLWNTTDKDCPLP